MARKRRREIKKKREDSVQEDLAQEASVQTEICLSSAEQELLCEMASNISYQHVVVEIANKAYESTEALARGAQLAGARVFNLALYGRKDSSEKSPGGDSDTGVVSHMNLSEGTNIATFLYESVYDLTRRWKESVALLVVIGYQSYEEVREAVICWQGYLCPEAIIVTYNCHEPGPARAIKEFITDGGNFILERTIDNMAALAIDKCQHHWIISSDEIGICRNCGRKRNFGRLAREATNLGIRRRTSYR
jgi:hypothetical protein